MEEKENRFAEASDGETTRNHPNIINGVFLLQHKKVRCEN